MKGKKHKSGVCAGGALGADHHGLNKYCIHSCFLTPDAMDQNINDPYLIEAAL